MCGWAFANERANAAFETQPAISWTKCKKCLENRLKRDVVRFDQALADCKVRGQ